MSNECLQWSCWLPEFDSILQSTPLSNCCCNLQSQMHPSEISSDDSKSNKNPDVAFSHAGVELLLKIISLQVQVAMCVHIPFPLYRFL